MSDGPKRIQTEPTMPSVQAHKLVPPGVREAYLNAEIAQSAASFVMQDDAVTMESCPACRDCKACRGAHAVTPEEAVAIREAMEKKS